VAAYRDAQRPASFLVEVPSSNEATLNATLPAVVSPLEAHYTKNPRLFFLEMYILGELGEVPRPLETDARRLVPQAFGGTDEAWLETLRDVFQGSTHLGDYVRRKWAAWKEEQSARGAIADPLAYARVMADERLAAEAPPKPVRAPDGALRCSCRCGAVAEVESDGEYFTRACWRRELDAARQSGLPVDYEAIERDVRTL
jgi:hypothetical protein